MRRWRTRAVRRVHSPVVSAPQRTCLGCRRSADQADLLRFVELQGQVVPDSGVRQAGRGAYVHRKPDCLDMALRRKAVGRALRVSGELDLTLLRQAIDTYQ